MYEEQRESSIRLLNRALAVIAVWPAVDGQLVLESATKHAICRRAYCSLALILFALAVGVSSVPHFDVLGRGRLCPVFRNAQKMQFLKQVERTARSSFDSGDQRCTLTRAFRSRPSNVTRGATKNVESQICCRCTICAPEIRSATPLPEI